MTTEIFYIPGLGDKYDPLRRLALKYWRKKNVTTTFIPMTWRDESETYDEKIRRIRNIVNQSAADNVVLVGESAGGSVVLSEVVNGITKAVKGITICGKNVRADRVSPSIYRRNPAFKESMQRADAAASAMTPDDGKKFAVFYSKYDPTVWLVDTKIPHATLYTLPVSGHFFSITAVLFFLKGRILKEAVK